MEEFEGYVYQVLSTGNPCRHYAGNETQEMGLLRADELLEVACGTLWVLNYGILLLVLLLIRFTQQ